MTLIKTLFLCLFILSGCSNLVNEQDLLSKNPKQSLDPLEVKTILTKYQYLRNGDFEFKIFPITRSYILSELNQLQSIRGLSNEEKDRFLKSREEQYLKDTTCAFFELTSINVPTEESLEDWEIHLSYGMGGKFPVIFNNSAVRTFSSLVNSFGGVKEKWTSYGIGCSRVKIPVENGFSILLSKLNSKGVTSLGSKITWGN